MKMCLIRKSDEYTKTLRCIRRSLMGVDGLSRQQGLMIWKYIQCFKYLNKIMQSMKRNRTDTNCIQSSYK